MEKERIIKHYSQHGEDYLLWRFFEFKKKGFYVDVGAFDGIHLSNTYSFEQQGWQGILVEAHPFYYELCEKNRPGSICVHAACVGNETLKEVEFQSETLGLLSGIKGGREKDVCKRYRNRGLNFEGFKKSRVPACTLNELFDRFLPGGTDIDFVSIDVEGTELDVLQGLDLARFSPRVLIVECNAVTENQRVKEYLAEVNGFVQARRIGANWIYTGNDDDAESIRRIAVDYKAERNLHPLGVDYTLPRFR
jgi:FkbM family methyltransferase